MRITIVTVCFNSASTIRDTLTSVAAQRGADVEHIIVDGGSTDETLSIVREFPHIATVITEPDKGIYDAMNKGLRLASGEAVGFLNSDDFFCRDDAIATITSALRDGRFAAVAANVAMVDRSDFTKVRRFYSVRGYRPWMLSFGHMPPHPTLYIRLDAIRQIGEFDDSYRIAGDFDMAVRLMLTHRLPVAFLNRTLVGFRFGGVSTKGFQAKMNTTREMARALRAHGIRTSMWRLYGRFAAKSLQYLMRSSNYSPPAFLKR